VQRHCAPECMLRNTTAKAVFAVKFAGFRKRNQFQRPRPILVSFRRNDDRNHIDEHQLNRVE
jgi:hypothetical protein